MKPWNRLTRRNFIKTTATAAISAPFVHCSRRKDKPNLLFIWTDQQRADTCAAYGNPVIQAPHLDRLARESILFERAYVTQPVCTPSRSTVMTGLWPHSTGCTANNIPLREETPCFPELVNDADYRTGYFGKWHLGDEIFAQHDFEEWAAIEDGYQKYNRPHRDPLARSAYHHFLLEKGYQPNTQEGTFSRDFASKLPIEHCKPKFLEEKACDFLQRHRREPFMLYVNFLEPHSPYNGPLNDLHDPQTVLLPASLNDPLEENEPLRYRLLQAYHRRDEAAWRSLLAKYYGLVAQVDRSVGRILETLKELGLDEQTVIVYTSDHGDMMGAHNLVAKTVMYEEAVRIPLLLRAPKGMHRGIRVESPISHIDLVPTLLDLLGVQPMVALPGESWLERIQDPSYAVSKPAFIQWNPAVFTNPAEQAPDSIPSISAQDRERVAKASVRTIISPEGLKLCLSDQDRCQLFDRMRDPHETTNLFNNPTYAEQQRHLTDLIVRWQESVADPVKVIV